MLADQVHFHQIVLRLMKHRHKIRTRFGISEGCIAWDVLQKLGGLGQGNGGWQCFPLVHGRVGFTSSVALIPVHVERGQVMY